MLLWQSLQSVCGDPFGLLLDGGTALSILPPPCSVSEGTVSESGLDESSPTPSINGFTPPWQFTHRGSWVKVGTILAKASIDFWVCASESGQTAASPPVDWARAREDRA